MSEEQKLKEEPADEPQKEPRRQEVGSPTEGSPEHQILALGKELEKCKKERDEYLAGWQRAKADFSNYQKDEGRRNEEFAKWALSGVISELLDILDSFELAISQSSNEETRMGLRLIQGQFFSALKKYGMDPISAERGSRFNPELHEAISNEPSDEPEDTILEEIQKGYLLHKRVLRPSKVKVSTRKSV